MMIASRRVSRAGARCRPTNVLRTWLLLAAVLPVLGCSGGGPHQTCESSFNSKNSPATGVVVASGNFATGESIILSVPINGQTQNFVGTTSPDGKHATFTGIPSGHYDNVTWIASCTNGEETLFANGTLDVM